MEKTERGMGMLCKICGREMQGNVRFCTHCGSKLDVPERSPYAPAEGEMRTQQIPSRLWEEFMQHAETAEPVQQEQTQMPAETEIQPRKRKKRLLHIGAAVLALVVLTTVILLTVKKTVYLPVGNVLLQESLTSEWVFDYDAKGRLTKLEYVYGMPGLSSGALKSRNMVIYYFYRPNGNLKRAEIYLADKGDYMMQIVVEYQYKGKKLKGFTVQSDEGQIPLTVECDR